MQNLTFLAPTTSPSVCNGNLDSSCKAYTTEKTQLLKDCVNWHQVIVCAYCGIVLLVIHLLRPSTIGWHSGGLSLRPLQEIIVMLREANSVRNIHSRVQSGPTDKYVLLLNNLQPFERDRIVRLREAGWAYRIASHVEQNVSVVCRSFQ